MIALSFGLLPMPRPLIERAYSSGFYPDLQSVLTPLTNLVPFAVVDVLLIMLALSLPAWWCIRIARAKRGQRWRTAGVLALHAVVLAAALFLLFELLWGLNYSRQPLAARLDYDEKRLSADGLRQLKRLTVLRLNVESGSVHSNPWPPDSDLRAKLIASLNAALAQLGGRHPVAAAMPKTSIFNFYLSAAGVDGFTSPFGLEVVLDPEVLPFERPFLLAHEWAHLAGYADESEASFVGLLACLQSDSAELRYSGLLALHELTPGPAENAEEEPRLEPEVLADLKAIAERVKRHRKPALRRAQWAVYDRFLKANRVEAGVASYGLALRLVVGTRFEPEWIPVLRAR